MDNIRDIRQKEFAEKWIDDGKFSVVNACPRFGKIRMSILILRELKPDSILIAYPDEKIRDSWKSDFEELNFNDENVTYTTHLSIKKYIDKSYDIVIIDEIHLLSSEQMHACGKLFKLNNVVLGLTGTLSKWTKIDLKRKLNLDVSVNYPIELGIKEGIISDYNITIIKVPLDDKVMIEFKRKVRTEKAQFKALTYIIDKLEEEGKDSMFLRLARYTILKNSIAKLNKTKELLSLYKNERILVFCGSIKSANRLGIPTHHSKNDNSKTFREFSEGKGNHLAVIQIGNSGITYKPLSKVIINSFSSNSEELTQKILRCMAFEYDNINKVSQIHIITTDEEVELKKLKTALEFFEKDKIQYK